MSQIAGFARATLIRSRMAAGSLLSSRVASASFAAASRVTGGNKMAAPVVNALLRAPMSTQIFHREDSFMSGSNNIYAEQMYAAWLRDPSSVHASWNAYFTNLSKGVGSEAAFSAAPAPGSAAPSLAAAAQVPAAGTVSSDVLALSYLIRAYQVRGHEIANVDPLGLYNFRPSTAPPELDFTTYGFTEADLDRTLNIPASTSGGHIGFLDDMAHGGLKVTLRQVIDKLRQTYCQTIGVEYMHIPSREKCNWIRKQVETPKWQTYTKEKKMHIFERMCYADTFEKFMGNKFNTVKRFGLEGGESVIPGLKELVDRGSELGCESFVIGMAHRGRLNVMANVMRKPMPQIFKEFQGSHFDLQEYLQHEANDWSSSGDVKYHMGTSMDRTYPDGRKVHLSLLANPSHLEAVDPVAVGKTRAQQFYSGDREEDKRKHMTVLIHGDAAFAGQGVVYETMQMCKVRDYGVGGTIHAVINNQVGFTTDPSSSRSTLYCSDLGKAFNVPVFHCNGDDPLAVASAFAMAAEWRQAFGEDVIIDMICYRRQGHNELDQPAFTQPILYERIRKHPDSLALFEQRLVAEGAVSKEELAGVRAAVQAAFERDFEVSKTWVNPEDDWLNSSWAGLKSPRQLSAIRPTGVDKALLQEIGTKAASVPAGFNVHPQLEKILAARRRNLAEGADIDWGTAESMAFGSLLSEGVHVRLSGQDVERGTFSHRHVVVHDVRTGDRYEPLNNLAKAVTTSPSMARAYTPESQSKLTVRNSILSEFGVLGFEYGYSMHNPNALVLWEAQFGDFSNSAQIMIDQFISSGEDKWLRQSGLTMLLPHGYDGQGAEHSSCRIERYLQLCDEDADVVPVMNETERMQIQRSNWQVCNVSTPANYFHLLRRQIHRDFRKPLVVAAPKNLLRHKRCVSTLEEMGPGTRFHRVFGESDASIVAQADKVRKVVMCSGKLYFELLQTREERGLKDVAIVRVEQLSPFPFDKIMAETDKYANAEVVWCQEEPKNMGYWQHVQPRIATALRHSTKGAGRAPVYVGRAPSAAPATGLGSKVHTKEQNDLINKALA